MDTLLKANLGQNWKDLERHRLSFFKRWLARAKELEVDERNLKEQLNEHVRHVPAREEASALQRNFGGLGVPGQTVVRGHSGRFSALWMDEGLTTVFELA